MTLFCMVVLISAPGRSWANLASGPSWWDENSVGNAPDWHYRVPITIPSTARVNATIKIDVDFNTLLSQMNIAGILTKVHPGSSNRTTPLLLFSSTPTRFIWGAPAG